MTRLGFLIITAVIVVLAVVWSRQHQTQSMPLIPTAHRVVIPWNLNTRCRIDSKNLPKRAEETV